MAGNALQWYTQTYSIEDNYSALTCTAVRQYGEGQKGFFDMPPSSSVSVSMGYRVYENAAKTRARIHHDYPGIIFDLLPEGTIKREAKVEEAASFLSLAAASIVATLTLSLAF